MSLEDELQALAREREDASQAALSQLMVDHPSKLLRQLRNYLAEQADRGRLKRTYDLPRLDTLEGGAQELVCDGVEFCSDAGLTFNIEMQQEQRGWLVTRFKFHLHLARRSINMVRIHLNPSAGYDLLNVPRCHLHIGDSRAHIPFPVMSSRLTLYLLCEWIEPDLGTQSIPNPI